MTFTGSNSYTGGTTLNGGALQIGSGGTVGAIAGNVNTGDPTNGTGTLVFNRSDAALVLSGVISGSAPSRSSARA